jgi:uncharacterized protein YkwD
MKFVKRLRMAGSGLALVAVAACGRPVPAPTPVLNPGAAPAPAPAPGPVSSVSQALLDAHNRERSASGLPPLSPDPRLDASARAHAEVMAELGLMAHEGLGDGTLATRLGAVGYGFSAAAENIAEGQRDVASVVAAWMGDLPHRANILGPSTQMGGAVAYGADGSPYWCVDFGSPR